MHAHRVLLYTSINTQPHSIYSEVSDVSNCISFSFAIPFATTLTAEEEEEEEDEEEDEDDEDVAESQAVGCSLPSESNACLGDGSLILNS